jgi:Collagen triple helix repeat (20 copies)
MTSIIQIQMLDEKTGKVIEDVIPLTEAKAVKLENGQTLETYLNNLVLQHGAKGDKGDTGATGPQGSVGQKGADGVTPSIGANGNWFLGSQDTGKPSRGANGATGVQGPAGPAGAKGDTGPQGIAGVAGAKGAKGDPGDSIKYGTDFATATNAKIFFKKI